MRRGPDWRSGSRDYDNGVPGIGVITLCGLPGVIWGNKGAKVVWNGDGGVNVYRIGYNDKYDLIVAEENGKCRRKFL